MNTGTVLIIAFICAALGYGAGLVLTRSSIKPKDPNLVETEDSGPRYEIHRLAVTLWSKTRHGPLLADLYGRNYNSRDEIPEVEKNRLINDIRTVEAWIGITANKPAPAPAAVSAAPAPEVPARPVEQATPTPVAPQPVVTVTAPVQPPPSKPAPIVHEGETELSDLPEELLATIIPPEPVTPVQARIDNVPKVKKEPAPKSIVEQINDILQEKIKHTAYAAEGIKLQETPQGVLVWVGKQSFQGIDSVPEGEAKAFIRAAVKEWEH
jgi:hypothetical protein